MKVKLNFLHICDEVIASIDGKISIIGMFSVINTLKVPANHPKFYIVVNMTADPGKYDQLIEIVSPSGRVVSKIEGKSVIIKEGGVSNFIANFVNTPLPELGRYNIRVSVEGKILSDDEGYFFDVIKKA